MNLDTPIDKAKQLIWKFERSNKKIVRELVNII